MEQLFIHHDDSEKLNLMNMDFFENAKPLTVSAADDTTEPVKEKKKPVKKRRKTKTKKLDDGTEIVSAEQDDDADFTKTNTPYSESYGETNNMLRNSIYQIDSLQSGINDELQKIKASKSLRKKYDYMAEFGSTMASLVGTKITAIREMNSSITQAHNLELKRMKDLKTTESEKDDDKQIMDMYNAFINTPVGTYNPLNTPPIQDVITNSNPNDIVKTDILSSTGDAQYDNYMNNMTPTQHMMLLESNPNVKTVLVYDKNTGNRWFDVRDLSTGQSIPNTDKPDQMIADDCTIDIRNNMAKNTNLNLSYDLVVLGDNSNPMQEY